MNFIIRAIIFGATVFPIAYPANLPIDILCGSPLDTFCISGCTKYTDVKLPPPYINLVYGPIIHYRIPLPTGVYFGWLTFVEPNKTASGQRMLSVSINGQPPSIPLDIFQLAPGDDITFKSTFIGTVSTNVLDIVITSNPGQNAILSEIVIVGTALDQQILTVVPTP